MTHFACTLLALAQELPSIDMSPPTKLVEYGIVGAVCAALVWLIFWQYKTIREQIKVNDTNQAAARSDLKEFVSTHRVETAKIMEALSHSIETSGHEVSTAVEKMTTGLAENSKALQFLAIFVQSVVRLVQDGGGKKLDPQTVSILVRAVRAEMSGG